MHARVNRRRIPWVVGAAAGVAAAACTDADCMASRGLALQSIGARVVAEANYGGCPGRGADARLVLRFRGTDPDSEVVVLERVRVTQLKWIAADRLLVGYESETPGLVREQLVRVADDSVRIVLQAVTARAPLTTPAPGTP